MPNKLDAAPFGFKLKYTYLDLEASLGPGQNAM